LKDARPVNDESVEQIENDRDLFETLLAERPVP
jgi:hypothetical protein